MMPVMGNVEGARDNRQANPERWRAIAGLTAHTAARERPDLWAVTGIPDSLADLEVPVESLWAAVQLAMSGADHDVLADTLGLTDQTARRVIIATTEQLLADQTPPTRLD